MTLDLVLIGKWYDLIASGEKLEEYREIKQYWIPRFCFYHQQHGPCGNLAEKECEQCLWDTISEWSAFPYDAVRFHRGYTSTTMTFEIESISIGQGREEWGAEPNKEYFVIKLGNRV